MATRQFIRTGIRALTALLLGGLVWGETSPCRAAVVTRGPYLQGDSPTNVVVRWRTDVETDSQVRFGQNVESLAALATDPVLTTNHEVNVTGLTPDTRYFYSVGSSETNLAGGDTNYFVRTPPLPGVAKPTRVWVIGDAGHANAGQVAVRNAYAAFTGARPTDLWLMLGDNAYSAGTDEEYQAGVFNIYTNLLCQSVVWPTLGNHDTAGATAYEDSYPYFDIFTLPRNGEAGGFASGSEHYYAFDHGNVHFICLDSMTANRQTNSAMYIWLTNDLANVTADWIIAFWHHPPYSHGGHNSDWETELVEMREVFLPVLEAGGVDLVLTGHSHSYERSFLLDAHYGHSSALNATNLLDAGTGRDEETGAYRKPEGGAIPHAGAVYAVVGSSGIVTGGPLDHPVMAVSLLALGSLVLDFSGPQMDATFLREDGSTNDHFSIRKVNFPPVASNATAEVAGDFPFSGTLSGHDVNRQPISFATNAPPQHGVLTTFDPVTGGFHYQPAHGFIGQDSFTFTAHDASTSSVPATVSFTVLPPLDANINGLPDYWESAFGVAEAGLDADADGATTAQEYFANTNPTNAASVLRLIGATRNAQGHCAITWASIGGTRYRVQYRDVDPLGPFLEITRPVADEMDRAPFGDASTMTFVDDFTRTGGPPSAGGRFFRVRVAP